MKHLLALIIKFIMVAVLLEIYLMLATPIGFGNILLLALVVTVVAYIIGDLLILPHSNNTVATICDLVLVFLVVYLFKFIDGYKMIGVVEAIISAVLICIGEWFFHKYMVKRVLSKDND